MEQMQGYRIGTGRNCFPVEELQRLPSIVALHQSSRVSDKYSFFSTLRVAGVLSQENWLPVLAQEQRVLTEDRKGFQKHMIRFRQPGVILEKVGDLAPEIILTNAHDATAAYIIMAGFFKLACLNGLIVSEGEFGAIRIRHIGFNQKDVIEATAKVIEEVPKLTEKIGDYRQIELRPQEQEAFAESALIIKFAEDEESKVARSGNALIIKSDTPGRDRAFSITDLLKPLREVDRGPTLWNTFNTVQEKITKGNHYERTVRLQPNGRVIKKTKVKGISAINESVRVNRGLWHLMEKMREIKATA